MKTGIELIAQKRREQVEKHGFDVTHDAELYENEELLSASYAYMIHHKNPELASEHWPWYSKWNPKDKITNLAKAGALIAAEIDRLQAGE